MNMKVGCYLRAVASMQVRKCGLSTGTADCRKNHSDLARFRSKPLIHKNSFNSDWIFYTACINSSCKQMREHAGLSFGVGEASAY